eukprot:m.30575 g.30575  ORF g.30575 m.30575 type:complete len:87 (+) comp9649_c0_seq2:86-346(+)
MEHCVTMRIPLPSAEEAEIAKKTLQVDKEPKPQECKRTISVENEMLIVKFEAKTLRVLRVATNWFLDMLMLSVETMEMFSPSAISE